MDGSDADGNGDRKEDENEAKRKRPKKVNSKSEELPVHGCSVQVTWDDNAEKLAGDEDGDCNGSWFGSNSDDDGSSPEPPEFDPNAEIRALEEQQSQFYPLRGERANELLDAEHHVIPVEDFRLPTTPKPKRTRKLTPREMNCYRMAVARIRKGNPPTSSLSCRLQSLNPQPSSALTRRGAFEAQYLHRPSSAHNLRGASQAQRLQRPSSISSNRARGAVQTQNFVCPPLNTIKGSFLNSRPQQARDGSSSTNDGRAVKRPNAPTQNPGPSAKRTPSSSGTDSNFGDGYDDFEDGLAATMTQMNTGEEETNQRQEQGNPPTPNRDEDMFATVDVSSPVLRARISEPLSTSTPNAQNRTPPTEFELRDPLATPTSRMNSLPRTTSFSSRTLFNSPNRHRNQNALQLNAPSISTVPDPTQRRTNTSAEPEADQQPVREEPVADDSFYNPGSDDYLFNEQK
ncbi:hypothetical protein L596_000870 [Steinernema carpocapsae]|uniref:Uncharacterized protein n=1 Tax=Steinernema carpocapsae TaxID=34508 RepID=A0A4U8UJP3_STECR|nr:hypothetical protein L596_000870 [Steinernema carpocapsae]